MEKLLFQFRQKLSTPTIESVCETFGLKTEEVDAEYGVVQTDANEGLFVVMVDEIARTRIDEKLKLLGADSDPAVGIFSNPRIEPFGPPTK